LNINVIYDSSVNSAPSAFKTTITAVVNFLDAQFTNPITINIDVGYGEIAGQSMANGALGESETYYDSVSYAQLRTALVQNAQSVDQISAANSLPAGDPTNGGNYWVTTADAKALGLIGASSAIDGYVGLASMYPFTYNDTDGVAAGTYDFFGVVAHEFTEVMGRALFVGTDGIGANAYTPLDLFHYSANGVRAFVGTTAGYVSPDGGRTDLDNLNTNPNGDFGDWASSAGHDAFLAFSPSGVANAVSTSDLRTMNILGYDEGLPPDATAPVLVVDNPLGVGVAKTATISASSLAFSDSDNTDAQLTYTMLTGPAHGTLLKSGAAVSSFTQADIDNGLVSYAENGTSVSSDSFSFSVSDPAGNHTATETFAFNVLPVTTIERYGATWLTQIGNEYYLYNTSGSGPALQFGGAPVVAGQFGAGVVPIGAEQTASGYDVAWEGTATGKFAVWATDANGDYVSSILSGASASSVALENLEPSFQQDLNGDGFVGVPPANGVTNTVIESNGSTWLTQVGSEYYLDGSSGTGPLLSFGGAPVLAGQFGAGVVPIGAERTASGYEVAWKGTATGNYAAWDTDANGNYLSAILGGASGSSFALEALEPSFQQDLNGDSTIGPPGKTVIETDGSTWLTQVGSNYYFYDSSGTGAELKFGGAPVAAGQFGAGVVPIGAEQTASGYEVAWEGTVTGKYAVWGTDTNGNYVSTILGGASGTSAALEALEPSFQQDLNGDGLVGGTTQSGILSDQDMSIPNVFSFGSAAGGRVNGASPSPSQIVATGDFYGNGGTEILWLGAGNTPELSVENGSSLDTVSLPAPLASWRLVGAADLSGDGRSEMLWQNSDGAVSTWQVGASGTLATSVPGNPGAAWQLTGAADVNGDGKSDLLFANPTTDQEQVWLMNGAQVASIQTFGGALPSTPAGSLASNPVLSEADAYYGTGAATSGWQGAGALLGAIGQTDPSIPPNPGSSLFART
jgi:20S proteasome alpha/beta subunit